MRVEATSPTRATCARILEAGAEAGYRLQEWNLSSTECDLIAPVHFPVDLRLFMEAAPSSGSKAGGRDDVLS